MNWDAIRAIGEIVVAARATLLFGMGRVVHRGKSIAFLEGKLRDASEALVATATATARLVRVEAGDFKLQRDTETAGGGVA